MTTIRRGFTLLEVMAAIVILSIGASAAFSWITSARAPAASRASPSRASSARAAACAASGSAALYTMRAMAVNGGYSAARRYALSRV